MDGNDSDQRHYAAEDPLDSHHPYQERVLRTFHPEAALHIQDLVACQAACQAARLAACLAACLAPPLAARHRLVARLAVVVHSHHLLSPL